MARHRCDFQYAYPHPHEHLDPGCQFKGETEFFPCDKTSFCRFHLPLRDAGGAETAKMGWNETQRERFHEDIKSSIATATARKGLANLTGVVFPDDIFFEGSNFPETLWYGASFQGVAQYQNSTFFGVAYFNQAVFSGNTNFSSVTFTEYVDFQEVTFSKDALFVSVVFSESTSFRATEFLEQTAFLGAKFRGAADFVGSTFSGNASFDTAEFADIGRFDRAVFSEYSGFIGTTFSGEVSFLAPTFLGDAVFFRASFLKYVDFEEAKFFGRADFGSVVLLVDADFKNAEFSGDADFSWALVADPSTSGEEGTQSRPVHNYGGTLKRFCFSSNKISGVTSFNNRVFADTTDFRNCVFEQPPKFHNAALHQETKWRGAVFKGAETEDAEDDYRTLRLAMDTIKNRRQEGVFFALEQQAMRHQAKGWELRAIASHLYDWSCRYGQSASRPLLWLMAFTVVFGLFYLAASGARWVDGVFVSEWATFTLRQTFKPFTVWGRLSPELIAPFQDGLSIWVKLMATLQSLISLGLFALFLLALRWQFRRA